MNRAVILAGGLLLALAGCDYVSFGSGGKDNSSAAAGSNASAAKSAAAQGGAPADAGLTSSRSLAGLNAGNAGNPAAGKDPMSISAGSQASIDPSALVGRWSDDAECKQEIELRSDGTFRSFTGGEGNWALSGDVLTLTGPNGAFQLRLQSATPEALTTINDQGQVGRSIRC
ncbi:MAG TPA: hypothetical protein VGX37_04340 [Allosphingosinicella sp.]|nr:hypothetical protein [Allosphingosinicella sp.]